MFTKNNTMNEILNTEPVGRAAGKALVKFMNLGQTQEHMAEQMLQALK